MKSASPFARVRRMRVEAVNSTIMVALTSIGLAGCGGGEAEDAPDLVEAHGTVTIDDSPADNVRVMFVSAKGSPAGITDSSGDYEIEYNDKLSGAFPGQTTVVVKRMAAAEFEDDPDADDEDDDAEYERKEQANVGSEWQVEIDVKEGGAPYNLNLNSKDAE